MSDIQLEDKDFEFLQAIKQEILTQDNRCTRNPMFEVRDRVKIWGIHSDYDASGACIINDSSDVTLQSIIETSYVSDEETVSELAEHGFSDEQIQEIIKFDNYNIQDLKTVDIGDIESYVNSLGCTVCYYRIDDTKIITYCYTEKAANNYIEKNKHNMHDPFVYVSYLDERNTEMNRIRDIITKYF